MPYIFKKTDSTNPDFQNLVQKLNAHFAVLNGEMDSFFAQFNKIDALKHVVVAFDNGKPIGCGAIRPFSATQIEVKRMFTEPDYRGQGVASSILSILENWAAELGFSETILETLEKETAVVRMYQHNGYQVMPNYGQYADSEMSICLHKVLIF